MVRLVVLSMTITIDFQIILNYLLLFLIVWIGLGLFFRVIINLESIEEMGQDKPSEADMMIVYIVFWPRILYCLAKYGHWH